MIRIAAEQTRPRVRPNPVLFVSSDGDLRADRLREAAWSDVGLHQLVDYGEDVAQEWSYAAGLKGRASMAALNELLESPLFARFRSLVRYAPAEFRPYKSLNDVGLLRLARKIEESRRPSFAWQ